jgi:menaquinone-dependent protoporphyrinogen IX oxidase
MQGDKGNSVVVYKSKYGSTKRYAQWIADELNADIFDVSEFKPSMLNGYATALFGSSVHIGKIKGIDFVEKNWSAFRNKRMAIFTTNGAPSTDKPKFQEPFKACLPAEICENVRYFPLPGAYNYDKLDLKDKLLMNLGPRMSLILRCYFKGDEKARKQLEAFCEEQDWTSKEAIKPIIEYIKGA